MPNLNYWLGLKEIRLLKDMTYKGELLKKGTIVTLPDWYVKMLINDGVAEEI